MDSTPSDPSSRTSHSEARARRRRSWLWGAIVPLLVGVLHGLLARLAFGAPSLQGVFAVMTVSFIFVVPLTLGFLTVWVAEFDGPVHWRRRLLLEIGSALIALAAALALAWEGMICVLLWLPMYVVLAVMGGGVAALLARWRTSATARNATLSGVVLAPYLLAPLELRIPRPDDVRVVENSIVIRAPLETVWANIERVPAFREEEHHFALSHLIGFPRPVEATLSHEGVGGVRHATFEGGVLFIETITHWEKHKRLTFSIHADATTIPPATLDEHVTVGGPYFDVLEGEYELHPQPDGSVRLELRSRHRVSTHFNAYATLWTDWIMSDVQSYILEIVRRRCEAAS